MRIVIHHPVRLPPRDYGGIERVVLWLARGLRERGHEVWIAAAPGSQLPDGVQLIEIPAEMSAPEALAPFLPRGIDVVHLMAPPRDPEVRLDFPWIATVHGNAASGERFPENTVFLSRDHAERHGGTEFVYNGVDPEEYLFSPGSKADHFLFLSKTSWRVKNVRGAYRLCAKSGAKLWIAGGHRPWDLHVRTWLRPGWRWCGPVAGEIKAKLLAESRALVFPVLWPEPFGLVVVEAMLSGTPVLAPPLGSLRELVSPSGGLLLGNDEEWLSALRGERKLPDPRECRDWALRRFTHRQMAEGYESIYRRVLGGERLHPRTPVAKGWRAVP